MPQFENACRSKLSKDIWAKKCAFRVFYLLLVPTIGNAGLPNKLPNEVRLVVEKMQQCYKWTGPDPRVEENATAVSNHKSECKQAETELKRFREKYKRNRTVQRILKKVEKDYSKPKPPSW